jgi:organic hydroperoxide reductase OsmC/OhrA
MPIKSQVATAREDRTPRRDIAMQPLPHRYHATATGADTGRVLLRHSGVPGIESAAPPEFGGPGDVWSPEGLLVAAVADCFVLTFRAIARSARFPWSALDVGVDGVLDRRDGVTAFTEIMLHARLRPTGACDADVAHRLLERAERGCLLSRSLRAPVRLTCELVSAPEPA